MESEESSKLPREFYEGVLSIKNALDDNDVPKVQVELALDSVEEAIIEALEHSGEADEEDEIEVESEE